jgi:adenylate cyclase
MKATRGSEEWWIQYLTEGHQLEGMARWLFPRLPGGERCKVCSVPFQGFGRFFKHFGWAPSSKNPRMCGFCSDRLPPGGANVELAVLVVDVRGYTSMSEQMSGLEVAEKMNKFFHDSTEILMTNDALIDKYLGDAVQALFLPGIAGKSFVESAVRAAKSISEHFAAKELPVGVTIHTGEAFVGNVGSAGIIDLTAMGDVVNTTHRLQSLAGAAEIVISEAVMKNIQEEGWEPVKSMLKGKAEEFSAFRKGTNASGAL